MSKVTKIIKSSINSDQDGWITELLYKEHIIFNEFHTFYDIKYIGDAAARAYVATSRIYHKFMLLKPITFDQSFTIQDLVNEVTIDFINRLNYSEYDMNFVFFFSFDFRLILGKA